MARRIDFTLGIRSAAQLELADDVMSVFNFAVHRNTTRHLRGRERLPAVVTAAAVREDALSSKKEVNGPQT